MPIENEFKLLLQHAHADQILNSLRSVPGVIWSDITQAYVNNSCRIRHVVLHDQTQPEQFVFTFKTRVRGATVEIEQNISIHDYSKLFLISKPVIVKTRAKIPCVDHHWDVDFLKKAKSGEIYCALAEVELPEFVQQVPEPHDAISPYMISWITQGDKRFNNRNLNNAQKVAKLIKDMCTHDKTQIPKHIHK